MYYLITINGSMISGRLIVKKQPDIKLLKAVHGSAQDQTTKPPESLIEIKHLTEVELFSGAGIQTAENLTENQIIRMYLDNNP